MAICPVKISCLYLNNLMRMLWEQHAAWTRMTIISIAEGLQDEQAVTQRLLRNPVDIGAALRPFYGNEAADRITALIRDHLVIAAELVTVSKAGDTAAAADAERRWYANADDIAAFLSEINPYWSKEAMTRMWHRHLDFVKSQAVHRLQKDYEADIADYDEGEQFILEMADTFTEGLLRQFPQCFQ